MQIIIIINKWICNIQTWFANVQASEEIHVCQVFAVKYANCSPVKTWKSPITKMGCWKSRPQIIWWKILATTSMKSIIRGKIHIITIFCSGQILMHHWFDSVWKLEFVSWPLHANAQRPEIPVKFKPFYCVLGLFSDLESRLMSSTDWFNPINPIHF